MSALKHITFIMPNIGNFRSYDATEPLVFAILKSMTPSTIETVLYDDRIEDIDYFIDTDLVAISINTMSALRAYKISEHFRKRGIPVVAGGYHPTLLPEEVLGYVDAIVIGDAEGVWLDLLDDAGSKSLKKRYHKKNSDFPSVVPDRSIFENKSYSLLRLLQFSRGCIHSCDFCSIKSFYPDKVRFKNISTLNAELESIKGKHVLFVDDNLLCGREHIDSLFASLRKYKIKWNCQISIELASDPQLLKKMRKAGCVSVLIGLESLDEQNRNEMAKSWSKKYDYSTAIRAIQKAGIMVIGTFVIGYSNDTVDSFNEILNFALNHKLFLTHFNPLMPFPKTALYDRLEKQRRLLYNKWWLEESCRYGDSLFLPEKITPKLLADCTYKTRTAFNKTSSIFRRLLEPYSNCRSFYNILLFLITNIITRREIHNKQGNTIGG